MISSLPHELVQGEHPKLGSFGDFACFSNRLVFGDPDLELFGNQTRVAG